MSTILKGVSSAIVYTPLVLLSLTVIFGIGYTIYYYRENNDLPYTFKRALDIVIYIFKTIILFPLKLLAQLLWFLVPIMPEKRFKWGFSKFGAWDSASNNRQFTLILLFISVFLGVSIYIYNNGYPDLIADYSYSLNYIMIALGIICLLIFFLKFVKQSTDTFPHDGDNSEKDSWLFKSTQRYLYILVSVGVAIGILAAVAFLVSKNLLFNVSASFLIMAGVVLAIMFLLYKYLLGSMFFKKNINNSPILNVLFYAIFIIPCLFFDTVKFFYNELRHTPETVYYILIFEILFVAIVTLFPILTKYLYTFTKNHNNKSLVIQNKINDIEKSIEQGKQKIKTLKKNLHSSKGKRIPDEGWKEIKKRGLNNKSNEEELIMFLINYGYKSDEMCDNDTSTKNKEDCKESINETIKLIQERAFEIFDMEHSISESIEYLATLKKERDEIKKFESAKVLLRDPIYLEHKKDLGRYGELKTNGLDIEYKYNYAISSWFFIRAQPPSYGKEYNKYTSILDYGGKPNISYNGKENTLLVTMNNGTTKKPITHKIKDFPLQKWNNIVINYDSGILDIFMNGKLKASFRNVLPYMTLDNITVGDEYGIGGGVCNVLYFPSAMSKERIYMNYKLLKNKNPPIV